MALTVRDVQGLEAELIESGRESKDPIDLLLRAAATWYETEEDSSRILDRGMFAHLCETIRSASDEEVRCLAVGALISVQRDAETRSERARFVARFALRRLCARTGNAFEWGGVAIPESDIREAEELFEIAQGESDESDGELISSATDYAAQHADGGDLFSRFAQDLELLTDVLTSPDFGEADREVARAALVYFVEVADAIPDDLGPVGLLDDAFVVRRAVEKIFPGRSVLSAYLDAVVRDWPFLTDLCFDSEDESRALSEFMVINSALLLTGADRTDESSQAAAVVAAEAGPLPFLMGFVRALAEIRSFANLRGLPEFEVGERLADRDSGSEVLFEGYGRFEGSKFEPCSAADATHFQAQHPGKKAGGDVTRTKPIADLASLRRSTKASGRLRRGNLALDHSASKLGPLERTFGSLVPIALPSRRARVIVVSPVAASKSLAETVTFHATRLSDVLPMGQARVDEDDIVNTRWTKDGPGGDDLLTVVRTSAEALELAEQADQDVLAVVAGVRPGSTDAANLRRLAGDGIPVLAVVEERDEEAQETFQRGDFCFWSWDEDWLRHLRWPSRGTQSTSHPVAAYEGRFRARASARVEVVELDLPALDDAKSALERLDRLSREREDESLEVALGGGFGTLVQLCRACVGSLERPTNSLESFRLHVESGTRWWPDEAVAAAEAALAALEAAISLLREKNPKQEFLSSWARTNPAGSVVAPPFVREAAGAMPEFAGLTWLAGAGRPAVTGPLLVPAWMGRGTMERLLVPPASPNVTLALYGPELSWYRSLTRRRTKSRERIRRLVQDRPTIPLAPRGVETPLPAPPPLDEPSSAEPLVDEIVDRVRRAHVLRRLGGDAAGDEAPARLVYFAGGAWVPFGPNHSVNTVTHLVESGPSGDSDTLREIPASELRSGDIVVMVRGSSHDALRHAADILLPAGTRETAALWRAALERFLDKGHKPGQLRYRLEREGCKRTAQTIRIWLKNERIIGPKDALDGTVEAIQRATSDPELGEKLQACKDAIHLVRSTHFTVAHKLAERVLERAREWLDADTRPDELVEVEERLVLLTVDSVDAELADVPRSALNRLREER